MAGEVGNSLQLPCNAITLCAISRGPSEMEENSQIYDMMMGLAGDVEYYSDRLSYKRLWDIRDKLQDIERLYTEEWESSEN